MIRARVLVGAVVVAAALTGATALPAHAGRRYVATYVPGLWVGCDARVSADWFVGYAVDPAPVPCMGAVTHVPVSHRDTRVRVRIEDATGSRIGGELRFYDQDGNTIPSRDGAGNVWKVRPFCGRAASAVPAGAARLSVGLHGDGCGETGGVATTGKVFALFS